MATGDAERRKIERNLHDGAQQHLVALAVNLRLAKDMLADDPEGAAEMLDALGRRVKDTIQELRDLAHGIYPPLLMDSGLAEALRAAANRSPLAVAVDADGVGATRARSRRRSTSAASRRCRTPASTRPRRQRRDHGRARTTGALRFEVRDDGAGLRRRRGHRRATAS